MKTSALRSLIQLSSNKKKDTVLKNIFINFDQSKLLYPRILSTHLHFALCLTQIEVSNTFFCYSS